MLLAISLFHKHPNVSLNVLIPTTPQELIVSTAILIAISVVSQQRTALPVQLECILTHQPTAVLLPVLTSSMEMIKLKIVPLATLPVENATTSTSV